jgi:succinate dehydrogenase/fumarate reductase cytochrome b subunit
MHEVEPSPVDDNDDTDPFSTTNPPSYPTNPSDITPSSLPPSARSTTNVLGLTPSRTLHILSTLQKYSILPFAIYSVAHYTNTSLIPLVTSSARDADKYLLLTRPYYQSFPLEPILIFIPVVTHVASGIALRLYRRRITALRHGAETHRQRKSIKKHIPWPKLSWTSVAGYVLYPMFVVHMVTMRIHPKNVDGSSASVGLRYWAHGIARSPWVGIPAYAAMVSVASYHFVSGIAKYTMLSSEYISEGGEDGRVKRQRRGWVVNGTAATMAGLWVAGMLRVFSTAGKAMGWEAKHWDEILRSIPVVGRWL